MTLIRVPAPRGSQLGHPGLAEVLGGAWREADVLPRAYPTYWRDTCNSHLSAWGRREKEGVPASKGYPEDSACPSRVGVFANTKSLVAFLTPGGVPPGGSLGAPRVAS